MPSPAKQVRFSFIKILTGSDLSRRRLPFMEARTATERPAVWLTACAHGDEVGGIVVIQEVFRRLRKHPLLRGCLRAFPLMNPLGFDMGSRNITLSKEDLNRSFPGSPTGSLAERLAGTIFGSIAQTEPDLVLDLHNDWIRSVPYAVLDPLPAPACLQTSRRAAELASHLGLMVVREGDHVMNSLSYRLVERGTPSLTIELGESFFVNEVNVEVGVETIWNALTFLEMVEPVPPAGKEPAFTVPPQAAGRVLEYSSRPFSSTSGVIRFLCRPGQGLSAGQPGARIYNAFGKPLETIRVERDSIVLGLADSAVAYPGAPVLALGVL